MKNYILAQAQKSDFEFLKYVHHTTLKEHVAKIWGWNEDQQNQFFKDAFNTRHFQLIAIGETSVGYLEINETQDTLNISNILILPEFQGKGVGSQIIKSIISNAKHTNKRVALGVFKVNTRARKLYEKLGFHIHGETPTHYLMELVS